MPKVFSKQADRTISASVWLTLVAQGFVVVTALQVSFESHLLGGREAFEKRFLLARMHVSGQSMALSELDAACTIQLQLGLDLSCALA